MNDWKLNEEIEIFRKYLRIPTVHPDIDYSMLKAQSQTLVTTQICYRFFMQIASKMCGVSEGAGQLTGYALPGLLSGEGG